MRELIIGIDGGGTKTNLVAIDIRDGQIAAAASCGSIHISTMGEGIARENLERGINGLGLERDDHILAVAIGDPAMDDSDHDSPETPLSFAAKKLSGTDKVFVKSDVFMAMYAAFGGEPGAFLVSGTGSMGIALAEPYRHGGTNRYLTVGGWGMPVTDPGSGFDIALKGIQAAFHAFDGTSGDTQLCRALLDFGGTDTPRQLIPWFNSGTRTRGEIARFAQCVDECARLDDAAAVSILHSAGHSLAQYALVLLKQLPRRRIGIYGSVLLENRTVYKIFEQDVLSVFPDARICCPRIPPEYGAVLFACDALQTDRRSWPWK